MDINTGMCNCIPVILVDGAEEYLVSPWVICGVSMIERQIRTLKASGYKIVNFYSGSGSGRDALRAFIAEKLAGRWLYKDMPFDVLGSDLLPTDAEYYILRDGKYAIDRRVIDWTCFSQSISLSRISLAQNSRIE